MTIDQQSIAFRVTVGAADLGDLSAIVTQLGGLQSEPLAAGSSSEALNAPVTGDDVVVAAQVISCVFTSAAAAARFVLAVKELRKKSKNNITAVDAKTGKDALK